MRNFNDLQKFTLKLLIFIVGASLILNALGTFADRIAPLEEWRFSYENKIATLNTNNLSIESVTLGNSHAEVDYDTLGMDGQSIGLAAADLFEIEKSVEYLEKKLPNLKTVLIAISYYSFSRDNAKFESLRPRRIGFYAMVPLMSPIQGDLSNFLMGKIEAVTHIMQVVRTDNWKGIWIELMHPTSAEERFPFDGVQTNSVWGTCSHYTAQQLDEHAREIAGKNVSSSFQMAYAHPGLEQDSFNALSRTIERLQSKGIRVILYTPAYYQKYSTYFAVDGSKITENMVTALKQLQQRYGVEYFDFSNDPSMVSHPELFYNSDHLNDCGQKVISQKLLEQMEKHAK